MTDETPGADAGSDRWTGRTFLGGLDFRDTASLIAVPVIHGLGQSIIFAVLPAIARDQGITEMRVALVYMLPAVVWTTATIWWGRRCDHQDRKPILLLSVLGFAVSMLIFGSVAAAAYAGVIGATVLWLLVLVSRLIYSCLSSGALPAVQSYLVARTEPGRRASAIGGITAAWNLGTLIGPGVVGALTLLGVLAPLFAAAAMAGVVWVVVRQCLGSQQPAPMPTGTTARLSPLDRRIRVPLLTGLCGSMAQATLLQTLGFFVIDGLAVDTLESARVVGLSLLMAGVATLFSQLFLVPALQCPAGSLERRGLAITCSALAAFLICDSVTDVCLATMLAGLGYGLTRPGNVTRASLAVAPHEQGAVAGINGAVWSAGYVLTPLFAMALHAADPHLPFIAGSAVLALALLLSLHDPGDARLARTG